MDEQKIQQKVLLDTISGDITLAEKQLRNLQSDIEQHQKVKGDSLDEYDKQVKLKQDQIDALEAEGKRLRNLILICTETLGTVEKEKEAQLVVFQKETQEAEAKVKGIYEDAQNRVKAVIDRENNVKIEEEKIKEASILLDKRQKDLETIDSSLTIKEAIISKSRAKLAEEEEKSKITLADKAEKLDDIKRQIPIQTDILEKIKREIEENTGKATAIIEDANEKNRKANDRSLILTMRDKKQNEREDEQNRRDIKLRDRSNTLRRAYREILQRGGNVENG